MLFFEHSKQALDGKILTRSKKPYKVILIDNHTVEEKKKSLAQAEITAKNACIPQGTDLKSQRCLRLV